MNFNDFQSFLRTSFHLGIQYLTQALEILNDQNLYPFTSVMCDHYVITTESGKFGFDCMDKQKN